MYLKDVQRFNFVLGLIKIYHHTNILCVCMRAFVIPPNKYANCHLQFLAKLKCSMMIEKQKSLIKLLTDFIEHCNLKKKTNEKETKN